MHWGPAHSCEQQTSLNEWMNSHLGQAPSSTHRFLISFTLQTHACMSWQASPPPPSRPTLAVYCNSICEQVTPLGFKLSNTKSFAFLYRTCLLTIIFLLFGLSPNGPPPFWVVKLRKRLGLWSQTIRFYLLRWEPRRVWFLALRGHNTFQLARMTKLPQKQRLLPRTGHSCSEVWPLLIVLWADRRRPVTLWDCLYDQGGN